MALAKVKSAEEMARLDAIWAELEAHKDELEEPKPDTRPQAEIDEENRKAKRALWLARAAMCRTYDIRAYFIENPDSKRRFIEFFVLMQKAAATAAIKAEEYK